MSILERAIQEINAKYGSSLTELIIDGSIQRPKNDKEEHIWYVGHEWSYKDQLYQSINYGSWKFSDNHTIKSWDNKTESQKGFKQSLVKHTQDAKIALEAKIAEKQKLCKLKWSPIFKHAKPDVIHDYLKYKGINNAFLSRVDRNGVLLVPAYNIDGFVGVQRIYEDPETKKFEKRFSSGIAIKGAFCPLSPFKDAPLIYVSEGFATAASIQLAFPRIPSICVWNAGNIPSAIGMLRSINPNCRIVIAADKDPLDPKMNIKPGEHFAKRASKAYANVIYKLPVFPADNPRWTDFNDLHQFGDLKQVQTQLTVTDTDFLSITPMGYLDSDYFYTSSSNNQIIRMSASAHASKVNFLQLAEMEYWQKNFGIVDEDTGSVMVPWANVASDMMKMCRDKGLFDPEKVRGRGVWFDNGIAVVNDGETVYPKPEKTVYHYQRTLSVPYYDTANPITDDELMPLLSAFANVRYKNQKDHIYVAAWYIQAQIFSCLDWRFHIWLSGPRGTGKSKIMEHVNNLLPHGLYTTDSTAAGIRQKARNDSLPVCYDESEPKGTKIKDVLDIARAMSPRNDSTALRGTSSGQVITSNGKMIFMFGSIQVELLNSADTSRIFIVEMSPEDNEERADWKTEVEPIFVGFQKEKSRIFARCFKSIPSIRQSILVVQKHLQSTRKDLDARLVDQLATLVACYWVYASMEPITTEEAESIINDHNLIGSDYIQDNSERIDSEDCLHDLLTVEVDNQSRNISYCIRMIRDHVEESVRSEYTRYLSTMGIRFYPAEKQIFIAKNSSKLRDKMKNFPDYTKILMRDPKICINAKTKRDIKDFGNVRGILVKLPEMA